MNEIVLTEKQQAEALHKRIKAFGSIIMQSFYELCVALKEMRDRGLYKVLGYSEFNLYCKSELGTSDRQVYKYIAIAENLPEDLVNSNSLIGVSKLYLLTTADEETRTEITETVDLESVTVKELQAQVNALRKDNAALVADRQREGARADTLSREKNAMQSQLDAANRQQEQLSQNVRSLEEQVRELESRPVEVAIPEPSHEVQNLQDAMRRINLEHEQWSAQIQDEHIKQVQEINKKHRAETDALRSEYEEKLAAAQAAPAEVPVPDSKEIFKAYLANAIDAAKRMTAFLTEHPNDACKEQAKKFFTAMLQEV